MGVHVQAGGCRHERERGHVGMSAQTQAQMQGQTARRRGARIRRQAQMHAHNAQDHAHAGTWAQARTRDDGRNLSTTT